MVSGSLVRDQASNIIKSARRSVGRVTEYEFAMPLKNADQGDALWERDQTYMIAVLVGPDQEYKGVTEDVWMSDQVLIRIGTPSKLSMYLMAQTAGQDGGMTRPRGGHDH